eukprot:g77963.t1
MSGDNLSDLAFNDEALLAAVSDEAKSGSSGEVEKEQQKEKEKTPSPSSPSPPAPSSPAQQELKEKKEQEEKEEKEKEEKEKEEKEKEKKEQEEKEKKEQEEKENEKEEKEKEKEKKEKEKEKEKKEQEEKETKEEKDKKEKEEKEREREEREQKANEKVNEDDPVQLAVVARMPKGVLSYWVASVTLASGNQKEVMHAERCWRICKPTDGVSISEHKRYTEQAWKDDFLSGQEVCLQFKKKPKKSSGWRVARFDVQLQDTGKYNTLAVWFYHEADRQKFLGLPSIMSHQMCSCDG